jgi:hypothetical protein
MKARPPVPAPNGAKAKENKAVTPAASTKGRKPPKSEGNDKKD